MLRKLENMLEDLKSVTLLEDYYNGQGEGRIILEYHGKEYVINVTKNKKGE